MQDKPSRTPAETEAHDDWSVLAQLLDEDDQRPWSVAELRLNVGDNKTWVIDSISRLQSGGLIHRTADDLIFPTRAAIYFAQLYE